MNVPIGTSSSTDVLSMTISVGSSFSSMTVKVIVFVTLNPSGSIDLNATFNDGSSSKSTGNAV